LPRPDRPQRVFDGSSPGWIKEGLAASISFALSEKFQVSLYHNQIARYFVSVGVRF